MIIVKYALVSVVVISLLLPIPAYAQNESRGLTISPVRQEQTVKPGTPARGSFMVGNATNESMKIDLMVEQFSVADYSYDYEFRAPPSNDWVKLKQSQVILAPNKTQKINYDIVVPRNSPPGGYYFSLFASTTVKGPGLPGTVRAASLLYMKVDGKLVRTSVMENASSPFWVTSSKVPYEFDVKNTGNVHFSAYFYGRIDWLFGSLPESGTSHLLMPNAIRKIEGSVPSPILPGVYKMTYGYKVDFADIEINQSRYIIFIPPWSVVLAVLLGYTSVKIWKNRRTMLLKIKRK